MDARARRIGRRVLRWTAWTAALAWVLANALDVFSMFVRVQLGEPLPVARFHPAEFFLAYAGMRFLTALACFLGAALVNVRWPALSQTAWGALTAGAVITAGVAWWRLYS